MKQSNYPIREQFDAISGAQAGKRRRLARLFSSVSGKTLIVPIDDSLIFGPTAGLEQLGSKIQKILADPPNAILAFPGVFRNSVNSLSDVPGIVNLTASTNLSHHTRKVQIASVRQAAQLGMDAVAVHVNISSKYESQMLRIFGSVSEECENHGMPLLGIMYPRSETERGDDNYDELKKNHPKRYADLIAHTARVGVDLGADLIKTKYTGDQESFRMVVDSCRPVPVIVAGGPVMPIDSMLQLAFDVINAGGAGISFGRNVFSREFPQPIISALKAIVHEGAFPQEAGSHIEGTIGHNNLNREKQ